MRRRAFSVIPVLSLLLCTFASVQLAAQGTAKELIAELRSGDSTRCMNAGNSTSEYQEHYQQLAAELATPLFDILENGPCSGSALTALVNVGPGIAEGVDTDRAVGALVKIVEEALSKGASYEAISDGGSAVLVIGHFEGKAAPAVPVLQRWILEREDAFDRRYGLLTLADIGDAAAPAVPKLLPLLEPPSEDDEHAYEKKEIRAEVVRALGSIPAAVQHSGPVLVKALSDEDYGYSYSAKESIAKIGAPMVPYLLPALSSADSEGKQAILELFAGMGADAAAAAPAIAPLLADEDWSVKYQAGSALAGIGPTPDGIAAVVKVLGKEDNEDGAVAAAEVLGGYGAGARSALPALKKAAASKNWSIANAAKDAVAAIEAAE